MAVIVGPRFEPDADGRIAPARSFATARLEGAEGCRYEASIAAGQGVLPQ
jgi:hypothetical protein